MKFKVPFMSCDSRKIDDNPYWCLCYPCLSIGWLYVHFSWEPVMHETVGLHTEITEQAMVDMIEQYVYGWKDPRLMTKEELLGDWEQALKKTGKR